MAKRTPGPSDRPARRYSATVFKARCLALLDDVADSRCAIVVTKHGVPVARVVPIDGAEGALHGSIVRQADLISPIDEPWDVES